MRGGGMKNGLATHLPREAVTHSRNHGFFPTATPTRESAIP